MNPQSPTTYCYDHPHNLIVRCSRHHHIEIVRLFPAGLEDVWKFHFDDYVDFLALVTVDTVQDLSARGGFLFGIPLMLIPTLGKRWKDLTA
ncbi:putative Ureohydrolase domain superfamily [Helianthus annuus]|uniref:Ureohydrolase domain superfamily n=1 Tax=Helianthus annuus TaxID=4232 RepID=A0A251TZ42_HELAN|nr:putative Ureohydrolase domain superfamily [Helianthus annuus]KAJ0527252.1 putative Ureohydrolase domain superfamily [Helianthus annuus]KAJ0535922.1 putative Ureohydrolase domain superfamily [Helianthus annuus]KAJ0543655.1 putative Ureohydrolase domain superfamily [Helianthus annuus]KAJ0708710.1 putative Ureohydrolase domain superfamily [Helianthus annuus]